MALFVLLVLVVAAIVEIWVAIRVADAIGALPTAALLLLSSIVGTNVLRRGAPWAWRRIAEASRTGERLGREVLDGGLIVVAGLLLLVPGLVSGVLGALLLLPPVRAIVRPGLAFLVLRRVSLPVVVGTRGAGWAAGQARGRWSERGRADDIEGHATERSGDGVDGRAPETRFDVPPTLGDGTRDDER